MLQPISIADYDYPLPEERIAAFPLADREASKLLVYQAGEIAHSQFAQVGNFLPEDCRLVRNETKVVQARLMMKRKTGGEVEVFCLYPLEPHREISRAMSVKGSCVWQCMAKKLKKWQIGETLLYWHYGPLLRATLVSKEDRYCQVKFEWDEPLTWAEMLEKVGQTPLPPYLHREAEEADKDRYQTVYAKQEGAVAAPTAGLHFTPRLMEDLAEMGIRTDALTLHVSAGTFQPVEAENALEHPMHREQLLYDKAFLQSQLDDPRPIVAVGTTSLRALESLYWYGVRLLEEGEGAPFFIPKLFPYEKRASLPAWEESIAAALESLNRTGEEILFGETEIMIVPGYAFKSAKGLITNFHQPQSTLLLLIAAFIGQDWKRVYQEAMGEGYRFLSYGDSSLLLR